MSTFGKRIVIFKNLQSIYWKVFDVLRCCYRRQLALRWKKIFLRNWCSLKMVKSTKDIVFLYASNLVALISRGNVLIQHHCLDQLIVFSISRLFLASRLNSKLFDWNLTLKHFNKQLVATFRLFKSRSYLFFLFLHRQKIQNLLIVVFVLLL